MSGGPPGVKLVAKAELRPGPQVRAWRPQGPDHPQLPQPIKELGTVVVPVKLHHQVTASVSVTVVKRQDAESAPAETASA